MTPVPSKGARGDVGQGKLGLNICLEALWSMKVRVKKR